MRQMKDSGIEWIGDIPEDWETMRIQFCLDEVVEKNDPIQTTQVLSLVKDKGVMLYEEKGDVGNKAKEDCNEYKIAYPNTLVVNSMNILIGSVGISNYFGCVSPVYYVFKEKKISDLRYINYIFNTTAFQKELRRYANGILEIRLRVSANDIFKRKIPLPDKSIQIKIANFLDGQCAKIDGLIVHEEAAIEELKAYKQSVITEAVTKGLDRSVSMKDSGVKWIEQIAENHEVIRLKFLLASQPQYGANESGERISENSVRYIRITDITLANKLNDDENNLYLPKDKAQGYILRDKDILLARSGATVGKSFIYYSSYGESAFAGYLIKIECNSTKLLPEYFFYFTQSSLYESWKNMIFIQATIQNIGAGKYANLEMIVTNIETQKNIIEYLNKKCEEIDSLISIKQQKIEKLKEYKKSLIYEYVTGKKEV